MIKNYLLLIFLFSSGMIFSQELYFFSGKNYTNYVYRDYNFQNNPNLQSGTGSFYEIGYSKHILKDKLRYSVGLALNDFNALGGNSANSYRWDTQYLGVKGSLFYKLYSAKGLLKKNIDFFVKSGLNMSSIIYGKQESNGVYYDLIHQKEFRGINMGTSIGLMVKYPISTIGGLSLGYDFSHSMNISNSSLEKLTFNTNHLVLGFHFNIN